MLALADLPILLSRVYWETKQLGGETDHTILSDEVKNAYSCSSTLFANGISLKHIVCV